MRKTLSGFLGLALSSLGLAGCGTFSIPRVAAQGTSILIPVPDLFGAGFGRVLNASLADGDIMPENNELSPVAGSRLEDFQRGELLFALRDGPSVGSNLRTYLPVRFITRVHFDEASGAALPAAGEAYLNLGTPVQSGQTVAIVDIPYDTPPNIYYVFMERWKRDPEAPSFFVKQAPVNIPAGYFGTLPWRAWADWTGGTSRPDWPLEIRVVASSYGSFFDATPRGFDKWNFNGNYSWRQYTEDLGYLVPHPKLRIWIGNPSTLEYPAAWEITLEYPAGKLEVTGASLGRRHRSGGFLSVSPTTGSPTGCSAPGSTRISLVDPERQTQWVDVVYRLRNFANCGRAVPGDFTAMAGSQKAYNVDGNSIVPIAYFDPEYSY